MEVDIGANENGDKFILGSQLHSYLGIKTVFINWIKSEIEKYGFEIGNDYDLMFNIPEEMTILKMESSNSE